jgi:nucleotide-binding universal stress UspA family protein
MYRSLLVPLDGSASAEQALPVALCIARRTGATLNLVSVKVPFPPIYGEGMARLENPLEADAREKARAYLDGVVQRLPAASHFAATATLLEGPVAETVCRKATTTGVDLVVMTVVGAGLWTRFWLGSVADELVRRLPMPVLLLRPQEPAPEPEREPTFRHLLIPLDGSAEAEQIVEPAVALGTLTQAEYTLLRVIKPLAPVSRPTGEPPRQQPEVSDEQLRVEAQAYLDRVSDRLRARSLRVRARVVIHEHPAVAILDAQAPGVDLIAFTTRGHRALPLLFLGSTADKVLRGASAPVLVRHPLHQPVPEGAVR